MGTLAISVTLACLLSVEPLNTPAACRIHGNQRLQVEHEIKLGKTSSKYTDLIDMVTVINYEANIDNTIYNLIFPCILGISRQNKCQILNNKIEIKYNHKCII